jgi:DNA-binding transcriptional LysR family regulator
MPPLAQYVSDSAPGVRISLVDLVPDDHVAKLKDHSVDMALIPRIEFPAWAEYRNVFKSRFVVGARRGHERLKRAGLLPGDTIPIDLFCDLGHIAFSQVGSLSVMGDTALARIGRQRRVAMTMPVFGGICHAIADSDFIALLPDQIGHKLGARLGLDLYETPMPIAPVQLCMVWHRRNAVSAAHRWLRDTVSVPKHHRNSPGANAL